MIFILLGLLLTQAPADKPVWSNTNIRQAMLLMVSPDSKKLYTIHPKAGGQNAASLLITCWDLATGKQLDQYSLENKEQAEFSLADNNRRLESIEASPDGKTLIVAWEVPFSGSRQNVYGFRDIQLFDLPTGKCRGELIRKVICFNPGRFASESRTCFSPDGKWFWVMKVRYGEQIDVYAADTGMLETTIKKIPKDRSPQSMAFTEDGTRVALFFQTHDNRYKVGMYSWPDAKPVTECLLPAERIWTCLHSWNGSRICLELMEEDEKSKQAAVAAGPHAVQAFRRVCVSMDIQAADPLSTMKKEPFLAGFRGESLGMPAIFWDYGTNWVASFTQHSNAQNVVQAAAGNATFYAWRDVKVMDSTTGKVLCQFQGMPFQCQVSQDGQYLVGIGAGPQVSDGIHVWKLAKP